MKLVKELQHLIKGCKILDDNLDVDGVRHVVYDTFSKDKQPNTIIPHHLLVD